MLHGIMKYRTTKETLCWYSRSRSKAPGAMGYWQAVMLQAKARPTDDPSKAQQLQSSHESLFSPSLVVFGSSKT